MLCSKAFILLWATQLLHMVTCSMVQLKNNGYEDLVIAINPALPENAKIIESIKTMVTEASTYLFHATQRRAFFKSVKILIPLTWVPQPSYLRPKTESFDKADVIIADPFLKYGDDPYTLQYGGCGEPGKYIHFTPNFMLDDTLVSVHGSRGRVFVHEWAHLRWGVFDEFNTERPFYISGNINVEATRCSKDIKGVYIFMECHGNSCKPRECSYDILTGLFEMDCTFIPEKKQNTKASIMYMHALSTVVEFCNSSTHNTEAPNLQNRMCNSVSTWDVIMRSADFQNTLPVTGTSSPAPPAFTLLQSSDRVLCLVLDISGSMSVSDRINRQYQAAELFLLQIIETGSFVGIVTFNCSAYIKADLRPILSEAARKTLVSFLPKTTGGGINLCAAIRKGLQVNRQSGNSDGTEIILLTAGEDNFNTRDCLPDITSSGAIIHVIALGPNADKSLEQIADMTGGLRFSASDKLDSNGLIDAFSGISSGSGNFSQQSIQIESAGLSLAHQQCLKSKVTVYSTMGNDTFFVVTWQITIPDITVVDPNGKIYSRGEFMVDANTRTARLQIPGTAQAGDWSYSLCNTHASVQILSITVTSRAANNNVPPVTVKAHMNKDATSYPNPMAVYAEVSQGFLPVLGAKVIAIIEPQTGKEVILELVDNGAGADIVKNDGIYSKYFTALSGNGRYSLKVRVEGKDKATKLGLRMQRSHAMYIPGYVENGVVKMNPLRPEVPGDDIQAKLGSFSGTVYGGSFVVSAVPNGPLRDVFPPSKITDLEAQITDNKIDLAWTAPGGDLDEGQAAVYEIRMSTNPLELRHNFEKAISVNATALTPQLAGSAETFSFIPKNLEIANGSIIYFAVRAIDEGTLKSDVSNTAQAAMFVPPTMTPFRVLPPTLPAPSTGSNSPSYNVVTVVIAVCFTVVVIALIICITLCVLSCNRKKKRPETGL